MSILINIEGADKTNLISFDSIGMIDNLNQQVDNFSFIIRNYGEVSYKPNLNDEVEVYKDSEKIFGGAIVKIEETLKAKNIINYTVTCNDYSHYLKQLIVTRRYTDTTLFDMLADIFDNFAPDFTYNAIAGDLTIKSFAFNRLNVADCLQKIADAISYVWYIDSDKDLHFFPKNTESALFDLSDDDDNFVKDSLIIKEDITQIRNSVLVQGGNAVSDTPRVEYITADGNNYMFVLANKYAEKPSITLNTILQDVGIDGLDNDGMFDVLWNYSGKTIRFNVTPSAADEIVVSAKYEYPILVKVQNAISISEFGKFEYAITDRSIKSQDEAIERAKAELTAYQNELYEGSFKTYKDGLKSGQIININSDKRERKIEVLIQSISAKVKDVNGDLFEYTVRFATLKTIGIIEYLQNQLRKEDIVDESSETLLTYADLGTDTISLLDSIGTPSVTSRPYYYSNDEGTTINKGVWDYSTWD